MASEAERSNLGQSRLVASDAVSLYPTAMKNYPMYSKQPVHMRLPEGGLFISSFGENIGYYDKDKNDVLDKIKNDVYDNPRSLNYCCFMDSKVTFRDTFFIPLGFRGDVLISNLPCNTNLVKLYNHLLR